MPLPGDAGPYVEGTVVDRLQSDRIDPIRIGQVAAELLHPETVEQRRPLVAIVGPPVKPIMVVPSVGFLDITYDYHPVFIM